MDEKKLARRPRRVKTAPRLWRDDGTTAPTAAEGRNHIYLAVERPETTLLSGQWEVSVPVGELDAAWALLAKAYPQELKGISVVKCPTLQQLYQQHQGHPENFYRELGNKKAVIALYVFDCTSLPLLRQSFTSVKELLGRYPIGFTLHEQQLTGRRAGFVFVDELNALRFSAPLYAAFCARNGVKAEPVKAREQAHFANRPAYSHDWCELPERFVVLDTETTGMDCAQGCITEIGAAVVRKADLQVVAEFSELLSIGEVRLDPFIVRLTGITDALLREQGQPPAAVLARLRSFVEDMPIVAHNVRFDKGFVDAAFLKASQTPLANRWVDSVDILRRALPDRPSYKLSALGAELLDGFVQQHRAMADVRTVVNLLKAALAKTGPS